VIVQVLAALFGGIVPDAIQLVRKQLKETVPTCNHNLVMSCFNLMDSLLQPYVGQEGAAPISLRVSATPIVYILPYHHCQRLTEAWQSLHGCR
jgi:hypothetical protein